MNGLMMDRPLLISSLLSHAETQHGEREIVSRRVEGDLHRTTYRTLGQRARQLANALAAMGIAHGDRVATLAWNGTATWSCTTRSRARVRCCTR